MKKLLLLSTFFLFIFIMQTASAQSNYINHTLKAGETLSALAKQYNTNVGDIMRENGMHADTKLVYGSTIKIPSAKTKINVQESQPVKQQTVSVSANAVKHKVVRGETLYSISKQYNITVDQIKSWNNLTDNSAKIGSDLIVGQSSSTAALNNLHADTKRQRVETTQTQVQPQQENEVVNNIVEEKKDNNADIRTNIEAANNQSSTPVNPDNNFTQVLSKSQIDAGYFQDQFDSKGKRKEHVSGVSKTFKTASGWNDGKYYILADNINPGTIVKLSADNGKTVYAKVLWSMGDLKENNGIDFRVSNATAAALNENAPSFNLNIYY